MFYAISYPQNQNCLHPIFPQILPNLQKFNHIFTIMYHYCPKWAMIFLYLKGLNEVLLFILIQIFLLE